MYLFFVSFVSCSLPLINLCLYVVLQLAIWLFIPHTDTQQLAIWLFIPHTDTQQLAIWLFIPRTDTQQKIQQT
jgi:antibiotic biosynthesis monooxygenase (ABM) superfamily enzyme